MENNNIVRLCQNNALSGCWYLTENEINNKMCIMLNFLFQITLFSGFTEKVEVEGC